MIISGESVQVARSLTDIGINQAIRDLETNRAVVSVSVHKNSGKLGGIPDFVSINTSPITNKYCMKKCDMLDICYAVRALYTYRQNACSKYAYNKYLLSLKSFDDDMMPRIPGSIGDVRIHAFGEVENKVMLDNILGLVSTYKNMQFTLYSRRDDLITRCDKPDNLQVVLSGKFVNDIDLTLPRNCDKRYLVHDGNLKLKDKRVHNCVGKCNDCMNCYKLDGKRYVVAKVK